jgi:hypothetical protein
MSALDQVVAFVRVLSSELLGTHFEPVYSGASIGDFGDFGAPDDSDETGEAMRRQPGFGALGIIGRPLAPSGGILAEAIALRVDDGLQPLAWRDLRINRALNPGGSGGTPAEGQLLFAGYGGAFLSHALTAADVGSARANISTWYVPFDFDAGGVPQKAHVISIDPTPGNSSISLVHADGVRIDLTEDAGAGSPGLVASIDGATFLRFSGGELSIQAERILLKGNCYVGRAAEAGLPLLAGAASPPCPSLFVSPT